MEELLKFGPLAGALTLAGAMLAVFSWLDTHFSENGKKKITNWLKGNSPWSVQGVLEEAFSVTFGPRILSFRGLGRSALVSTLCICVLSVIYVFTRRVFWTNSDYVSEIDWATRLRYFMLMATMVNIPSDYIGVIISAVFIKYTKKLNLPLRICAYFSLCLACILVYMSFTAIVDTQIGFSDSAFGATPFHHIWDAFNLTLDWEYLKSTLKWEPVIYWSGGSIAPFFEIFSYGPFVYSSVLVMAWMGVYSSAAIGANLFLRSASTWSIWLEFFDIEKFPLKCIGIIAAFASGVLYFCCASLAAVWMH